MAFIKVGDECPITAIFEPKLMDQEKTEKALQTVKQSIQYKEEDLAEVKEDQE